MSLFTTLPAWSAFDPEGPTLSAVLSPKASFELDWKKRFPLPDGRDGLNRSFLHIATCCSVKLYPRGVIINRTIVNWKKKSEAIGLWQSLGPLIPDVKPFFYGAPARCWEESTGLMHNVVTPDEWLMFGLKSWCRGQKSQLASLDCLGGVSAVIVSYDLDVHALINRWTSSNQPSWPLPLKLFT